MAMGATLVAGGVATSGAAAGYAMAGGAAGVALGMLYLLSPAWRLTVIVDEESLAVARGGTVRWYLLWRDVVRVVASAETKTCFVDGGVPERSLLVPGPGASAPYDIENKAVLYEMIIEHVAPSRIQWTPLLERAHLAPDASAAAGAAPGAEAGAAPGAEAGAAPGAEGGADATADRESGK